jgi:SAM-dependent methyltransferase
LPGLKAARVLDSLPRDRERLRILDYGCGEGKLVKTLSQHRDADAHGADIQRPLENPAFPFYLLPAERSEVPRGFFDVVTSVDVLEHVRDLDEALSLIRDALVEEGLFVGFVPTEGEALAPHRLWRRLLGDRLYERTKDHFRAWTRKAFLAALEPYFTVVDVSYSYHALGSLFDSSFFALCSLPIVERWWWSRNPYYRPGVKMTSTSQIMRSANALCFVESTLLKSVALSATGLHFTARRRS